MDNRFLSPFVNYYSIRYVLTDAFFYTIICMYRSTLLFLYDNHNDERCWIVVVVLVILVGGNTRHKSIPVRYRNHDAAVVNGVTNDDMTCTGIRMV